MFEQLTFTNENEKHEYKKYLYLKGEYLHKQVYDILLEKNKEPVSYQELSSLIRYDKNLRDTLYIYLATCEEYLRALLLKHYDVEETCHKFKQHDYNLLMQALQEKNDFSQSNLYFKLNVDFSVLLQICQEKNLIDITSSTIEAIKTLRNHTMHHALLILGQAQNLKEAYDNFNALEKQLNALLSLLPQEYQNGFIASIKKLNGTGRKKFLQKFYLEYKDDKLHIKTND
ncbi:MAG: hypothetical protein IJ938_02450 [Clostridia bacterium]|nr:hypothetical protein [Clostridia bacterium]